jgi:hypothetical protein
LAAFLSSASYAVAPNAGQILEDLRMLPYSRSNVSNLQEAHTKAHEILDRTTRIIEFLSRGGHYEKVGTRWQLAHQMALAKVAEIELAVNTLEDKDRTEIYRQTCRVIVAARALGTF